jgi:hypothetical protein
VPDGPAGTADAILFGVAADLSYNIMSATNSSPQTTELFAGQRADTLWKYVRIGLLQVGVLVGIMAVRAAADGGWRRGFWAAAGGVAAGVSMYGMYAHALAAGGGQKS